jgi:hypothetical protein
LPGPGPVIRLTSGGVLGIRALGFVRHCWVHLRCHGGSGSLANAAPKWQATSLRWQSRERAVACPLEGLVGLDREAWAYGNALKEKRRL